MLLVQVYDDKGVKGGEFQVDTYLCTRAQCYYIHTESSYVRLDGVPREEESRT